MDFRKMTKEEEKRTHGKKSPQKSNGDNYSYQLTPKTKEEFDFLSENFRCFSLKTEKVVTVISRRANGEPNIFTIFEAE